VDADRRLGVGVLKKLRLCDGAADADERLTARGEIRVLGDD
jgi:hypothetical protein